MAEVSGVSLLIARSAAGDEQAWNELVRRYAPLVMAVIRSYRLGAADAQDVSQTVWLRLVEHLAHIREPEALPGWLATTTQRECGRHVRQGDRVRPVDPLYDRSMRQATTAVAGPDARILRAELHQALREGLAELPARDQQLLRLRVADPPLSYQEISELLGMRVGSIGPTLRRSLDKLRDTSPIQAYFGVIRVTGGATGGDRRELAQAE
jgi:RNA polymerase sigma factor (sigma-70 family)